MNAPLATATALLRFVLAQTRPDCAKKDGSVCAYVWNLTHNASLASSSNWLIAKPATILAILVVALMARVIAHRFINRITNTTAEGRMPPVLRRLRHRAPGRLLESSALLSERRRQRAQTLGSVLRSITSAVIFVIALMFVLDQLTINLAPLLASAGIVGVAVGFGAQNLVRDFLSGMFMILEDQYGVGDVIDIGEATGSVEAVGLRTTQLRDVNGTVWYVRNGEVVRVGNMSQGWSRAVIDVPLAYDSDLTRARIALKEVIDEVWRDPAFAERIIEEPLVVGVEAMTREGLAVRVMVKTRPLEQWDVARELRARIKERFDREHIQMPYAVAPVVFGPAPEDGDAHDDGDAPDR